MFDPNTPIQILRTQVILYVDDQQRSAAFYKRLLRCDPLLDVPGMTEFELSPGCKLGLMPNNGIARILGEKMPHPATGNGIPRCELYLMVANVQAEYEHALGEGATTIAPPEPRDWGDTVCYLADPDGHVIAFAAPGGG